MSISNVNAEELIKSLTVDEFNAHMDDILNILSVKGFLWKLFDLYKSAIIDNLILFVARGVDNFSNHKVSYETEKTTEEFLGMLLACSTTDLMSLHIEKEKYLNKIEVGTDREDKEYIGWHISQFWEQAERELYLGKRYLRSKSYIVDIESYYVEDELLLDRTAMDAYTMLIQYNNQYYRYYFSNRDRISRILKKYKETLDKCKKTCTKELEDERI